MMWIGLHIVRSLCRFECPKGASAGRLLEGRGIPPRSLRGSPRFGSPTVGPSQDPIVPPTSRLSAVPSAGFLVGTPPPIFSHYHGVFGWRLLCAVYGAYLRRFDGELFIGHWCCACGAGGPQFRRRRSIRRPDADGHGGIRGDRRARMGHRGPGPKGPPGGARSCVVRLPIARIRGAGAKDQPTTTP